MFVEAKDYYRVLHVPRSASEQEIHKAYRLLARSYHPDINPSANATEHMAEINAAYGTLRDSYKRMLYDRGLAHGTVSGKSHSAASVYTASQAEVFREQQERSRERARRQREAAARRQPANGAQAGKSQPVEAQPVERKVVPLHGGTAAGLRQVFHEVKDLYTKNHNLSDRDAKAAALLTFSLCGVVGAVVTVIPFIIWHVSF
jgi:curved DNA-binding protein CbpA